MVGTGSGRTYSIKEVAALVGLPASTLRYYEDVSVIPAIARDPSSGHRIYQEDDLELLTWVSCLSASGIFPSSLLCWSSRMNAWGKKRGFSSCGVSSCERRSPTGVRSRVRTFRKPSVWTLWHVLSLSA